MFAGQRKMVTKNDKKNKLDAEQGKNVFNYTANGIISECKRKKKKKEKKSCEEAKQFNPTYFLIAVHKRRYKC